MSNIQHIATADTIENWLLERVAQKLAIAPEEINVQLPLDSYGLNSADALSLISEGEEMLGLEISPMLLWYYPTIESLSQRLAEESETSESEMFEI